MRSREHIAFLAGSTNRVRILETLCEQPYRQCELIRECGLSRSTVHRTLDGLAAREWIYNDNGQYRLTPGGKLVLERYEALETSIEQVEEWGPFLTRLGDVAATLPPAALDDATMVTNTSGNPHAAIGHIADVFETSDTATFRCISPIVSPVLRKAARELFENGVEMEVLIDDSALGESRVDYPDAFKDSDTRSHFEIFLSPDDLSFGFTILDERVLIGAYDERGVRWGCLDGTNEALTKWATEMYEEYRDRAKPADSVLQLD